MDALKGLVKNISDKDQRTLAEIKEQVKEAKMEQKNVIKFPISRVAFDRLFGRLLAMGVDAKFVNSSGNRSSYMELRF